MWDVARAAMPGVPIQDAAWLNDYDAYYYSQKGRKSLPVLRIRYADAPHTWLYLDPRTRRDRIQTRASPRAGIAGCTTAFTAWTFPSCITSVRCGT